MTDLFVRSESVTEISDRILIYGYQFTSKTHALLGFPNVALCDVEGKAKHMVSQFKFALAEAPTIERVRDVLQAVRVGKVPCDTFGFDSASAYYDKLVMAHTKETRRGDGGLNVTTDWVTVNRRFLALRDFCFELMGKTVIFIAHAEEKYNRSGDNFTSRGVNFVGPQSFRRPFDYIFRTELVNERAGPAGSPVRFHVEKTGSPHLQAGSYIEVRPSGVFAEQFYAITRPAPKRKASPAIAEAAPAQTAARHDARADERALEDSLLEDLAPDDATPQATETPASAPADPLGLLDEGARRTIEALAAFKKIDLGTDRGRTRLRLLVRSIDGAAQLAPENVALLLEKLKAEGTAAA